MGDGSLREFVQRIPKAELHCHLEGAIPPSLLLELAERNGVELPFQTAAQAREALDFEDLSEFIDFFSHAARVLRRPADFADVVEHIAETSQRQNIQYREVTFSFGYYAQTVAWSDVIRGLAEGRQRARDRYGVEIRFVAGTVRMNTPETAVSLVKRAHTSRDEVAIVAIGMGGKERGFPAHRHRAAFELAAERGFHRLAHAGEAAGPSSVWDTLVALDIDRIDHGVRAIEDDILLEYIATEQIPLTVCPVSNVALNVYGNLAEHPVARLFDADVPVTLNSDDPALLRANLVDNYLAVATEFGLGVSEIEALARNSFTHSFLPEHERAAYLEELERDVDRLRSELSL